MSLRSRQQREQAGGVEVKIGATSEGSSQQEATWKRARGKAIAHRLAAEKGEEA